MSDTGAADSALATPAADGITALEHVAAAAPITAAQVPPKRYDPFNYLPGFLGERLRKINSRWVFLLGMSPLLLLLLLITVAEGSFGTAADFRPIDDLVNLFSESMPQSEPHFPLIRDLSSVMLILLIVMGYALLHRQWLQIIEGLAEMRDSGTIKPRIEPISNRISRLLRVDNHISRGTGDSALEKLDARFATVSIRAKVTWAILILALAAVPEWILYQEVTDHLFGQLVPTGLSAADQGAWLAQARHSWWADWQHPFGAAFFVLITYLGVVLIIVSNVVGIRNVHYMVSLYFAAEPSVDWYNRDGRYGWSPVGRMFRTLYWALVMLGVSVAMLVVFIGPDGPIAWVSLVALYVLLAPIYLFIPYVVFRRIEESAKAKRRKELDLALAAEAGDDLERRQLFIAEYERCNMATIRPMQTRNAKTGAFATLVLLPILLTLLQIYGPGLGQ